MQHILKTAIVGLFLVGSSVHASQYQPGVADSIPATPREKMRAMYREYTRNNMTTGYVYTCGYADVLLTEAKKLGLSLADVDDLAQENVNNYREVFDEIVIKNMKTRKSWDGLHSSVSLYNVRRLQETHEKELATLVERAILIRQLIYSCGQQKGL